MTANYHTHTYLCQHASGLPEEYLQTAIKNGLEILGFSDHAPFYFPDGYVSGCRMRMEQIDFYFDTLLALREKYKDYIDIKIGFEIEYYPRYWDKALEKYRQYPLDYLILGNHFLGNEGMEHTVISSPTEDENLLKRYVDECITAINTGRITYLCHPDMMLYTKDDEIYEREMSRLILEANRLNMPIEINLLGARVKRHYPRDFFWEIAGRLGATAILGCDAHSPEHVGVKSEIEAAEKYAEKFGIPLLDKITLKNPLF